MITVDFDDDAVTGAFRYLINNIGRVMDYYAARNPDKPIDDVYLTGDGALIRGIDGLFKIQLNVSTKVMDSLYNVKFDDKINTQIYNPVYLISAIGAAMNPMGFVLREQAEKAAGKASTAIFVVIFVLAVLASIAMVGVSAIKRTAAKSAKASVERQIAEIQDIEQIYNDYLTAQAQYNEMLTFYDSTKISNEYMREFWDTLEEKLPTNINVTSFSSSSGAISLAMESTDYDSIARLVVELRDIDCIENAFISSITQDVDEETGAVLYEYVVTCNYILPEYEGTTTEAAAPVVDDSADDEDSVE
jgi:type IV pilus assembly protein PilM